MITALLNKLISNWKGQPYQLDSRIPPAYLWKLSVARWVMLCNGKISGVKNNGLFFLSTKANIKCRSKMKVGRSVSIERGCYIDALSTDGIRFGNNVSAGRNVKIIGTGHLQLLGKGLVVGNNVGLGTECFYGCGGGISIGDDTIIGDYVSFHAENHVYKNPAQLIRLQGVQRKGIIVGPNCWIGAKCTVLDGVEIEEGCVIAAGSLLTAGRYAANSIYGGVPAKFIKTRTEMKPVFHETRQ